MTFHLGDIVPNFTAQSTEGKINFHEYIGDSWGVLFSHPADYTLVCTTELGRRNFVEVLRAIDSLQLTAKYSVATPADWKNGEDVIVVPAVSTKDAQQKFPKGLKIVKPHLRYTPQPDID